MSDNRKLYLKSLGIAAVIEVIVLAFTLLPILDGFMVHSAIGATQRPILTQFLGWFGMAFHLPSLILTFWFPPFAPIVQIFIVGSLVYIRFCVLEKRAIEKRSQDNSTKVRISYSDKDEVAGRYWL